MVGQTDAWDTAQNRAAERGIPAGASPQAGPDWLALSRQAYQGSSTFIEANLRSQWQKNLRHFNSRHQTGSKYHSDEYKHRSKLFRPKTRATVRRSEAYAAQAFFSTQDLVMVDPTDEDNPDQVVSAKICKELLNLRLDQKPIRWFLTAIGAYQDTQTTGICVSKQYWEYEERVAGTSFRPAIDEATGMPKIDAAGGPVFEEFETVEVVKDEPRCRLVPAENIRFDPGADWMDPINSSPYVIELIPMYVCDVKARMRRKDPKTGIPAWYELSDAAIKSARTNTYNSTRQARENNREDSKDTNSPVSDYDIVWVHENCLRYDGQDWIFFTLGVHHLLSQPVRLEEVYRMGERPWVMGYSSLETHKTYPAGKVELVQDLQVEANEIANQRIDNVRLALNPRFLYRVDGNVDLKALARSVPGGPIGMNRPGGTDPDLIIDRPPDVTASSYAEQDRLNVDFDELAGSFSTSSVQTNRQLNETVGGMELLAGGANTLNDYDLRLFTETWVEPVLRQLVKLEQRYETDTALIAVAAKKAKLWQRFGIDRITDDMLQGEFTLRVNVGIGATDPTQRLERFMAGAKVLGEIFGEDLRMDMNRQEVASEVFGILGYRDGDRFFMWGGDDDPRIEQLGHQIEMLMQIIEGQQVEQQAKIDLEKLKGSFNLQKQKMGDMTKVLIELLKQQGQQEMADAQFASQAYQTAHQSRNAAEDRRFKAAQADQDRGFQAAQSNQERQFQAREAAENRRLEQQRYTVH